MCVFIPIATGWVKATAEEDSDQIVISKLEKKDGYSQLGVVIDCDLHWHVHLVSQKIASSSFPLSNLPQVISSASDVQKIVKYLDTCTICIGNDDEKYGALLPSRNGVFMDASGLEMSLFVLKAAVMLH